MFFHWKTPEAATYVRKLVLMLHTLYLLISNAETRNCKPHLFWPWKSCWRVLLYLKENHNIFRKGIYCATLENTNLLINEIWKQHDYLRLQLTSCKPLPKISRRTTKIYSVDFRYLHFRFKPENEVDFRWKPSKQNHCLVTKQNKTAPDEEFAARNFIFLMSTSCCRDGSIFRRNSTSHFWVSRRTYTDKSLVS